MGAHRIWLERPCCDLHRLPLPDAWADHVVSSATLHHSSNLPALAREVARVLRPGGSFAFVSEPVKKVAIKERRPRNVEVEAGINEHIYTYMEYARALRAAGLHLRHLRPRSVRYRLFYPDPAFIDGLPAPFRFVRATRAGRRLIETLVGGRMTGRCFCRYASLPLSMIATRPACGRCGPSPPHGAQRARRDGV